EWIRKLLGADEFINGKERWCIWLVDATQEQIDAMPLIKKRVEAVRALRVKAGHPAALKMSQKPHIFMQVCQPRSGNYILVPGVSS
ncbi:type IIL restriction-modification enzyme MmeI, partial [Salmonella enterica]